MKKIIFLFVICLNVFAVDCELIKLNDFGKKGLSDNVHMSFKDTTSLANKTFEYQLDESSKLKLEYITKVDPVTGSDYVVAMLDLLIHKGGNGYTVESSTPSIQNNFTDDQVVFDLSYIFGNRSESLDYQLSERIALQNFVLECSIL